MNTDTALKFKLSCLITKLLDQTIDEAEFLELEQTINNDPVLFAFYIDFMTVHAGLKLSRDISINSHPVMAEVASHVPEIQVETDPAMLEDTRCFAEIVEADIDRLNRTEDFDKQEINDITPVRPLHRTRPSRVQLLNVIIKAAAIILLCLAIIGLDRWIMRESAIHPRRVVAQLIDQLDVQWDKTSRLPHNDGRMSQDTYQLNQGCAHIRFNSGAEVLIEGPAQWVLLDEDAMQLNTGRAYANVPEQAIGFAIKTDQAKIIDLGTEFGVEVDRDRNTQLHVIKGKTLLISGMEYDKKAQCEVTFGQARQVNPIGQVKTIALDSHRYVRQIDSHSHLRWKGQSSIDLADIIGGGDGFGTGRRGSGVNPATGQPVIFDQKKLVLLYTGSSPADSNPFIDTVFVPKIGSETVISTSGLHLNDLPQTDGRCYANIINQGEILYYGMGLPSGPCSSRCVMAGQAYGIDNQSAIYMHANAGITFDLAAIREKLGSSLQLTAFRSLAGVPDDLIKDAEHGSASIDIWVAIDGEIRQQALKQLCGSEPLEIDLPLTGKERFLTLVITDHGDGSGMDLGLFAEPSLVISQIND